MTGPSLADRRAAACALAERLTAEGRRVEIVDRALTPGTGPERTGVLAEVLARNGIVAIAPGTADRPPASVVARHAASGTRCVELGVPSGAHPADAADTAYTQLTGHGERAVSAHPGGAHRQRA
ncbi:hypothetical protein ABZX40_03670 [Streptomyces sp. NPDC004610]|uniref:hypothetical protein n=1 Tax=unclassified Streptomyces TaxID=2593676 RepID=UPI0033AFABF7